MTQNEGILMTVRNHLVQADEKLKSGDYDGARTSTEQAIDVALQQNHASSMAHAYYSMASVIWGSGGDWQQAHYYASLALQNSKTNSTVDLLVRTLIARLKAGRGNYDAAIAINEELLRYYFEQNDFRGLADILRSLGDIYLATGDYEKAHTRYYESIRLYRNDVTDPLNYAGVLVSMGSLKYQTDDKTEARQYWAEARQIAEANGFRQIIEGIDQAQAELFDG